MQKTQNKIIFMFSFFICFHIMLFFGWLTCIDNVIGCNFMVLYATNILWTISYFWMLLLVVPSLQLFMNNSCIAKILFSVHVSIFVCAYFFLLGFFFIFFSHYPPFFFFGWHKRTSLKLIARCRAYCTTILTVNQTPMGNWPHLPKPVTG